MYYLTHGFIASTRTFNLLTRAFNLPARAINLATCAFSLLTRGFELLTCISELVTRNSQFVFYFSALTNVLWRKKVDELHYQLDLEILPYFDYASQTEKSVCTPY